MIDLNGGPPQPEVVKHLGKLIDLLGFDELYVGGNSYGGLLSSLLYFDRPAQVKKVVIMGSASTFHPPEEIAETLKGSFANAMTAMENPTWETAVQRLANITF